MWRPISELTDWRALSADSWDEISRGRVKLQKHLEAVIKSLHDWQIAERQRWRGWQAGTIKKPSLLVIDDDPVGGRKIVAELEKEGYQVSWARTGEQGLSLLDRQKVDLILLDIVLSDADGLEICRQLKTSPVTAGVPVVFVTAMGDDDVIRRGFAYGGQDYVRKPVKTFELLARVKTHLTIKQTQDQLAQLNTELNEANRIVRDQNRQLIETINELETAAITDVLTGLNNRRYMHTRLSEAIGLAGRGMSGFSLIMADIDFFKAVNDTYGHNGGDSVLRVVAETIRAGIRKIDVAARWGGEEFLVLLPGVGLAEAAACAERLRAAVAGRELMLGDRSLRVTMSQGVAEWQPGDREETVVHAADRRLYLAKSGGRNKVVSEG
ncbi:MAG: diguanylate cyclase [Negativicutes bacterium]|nr:diguanylate cyclase [Negativicutes bacterium]